MRPFIYYSPEFAIPSFAFMLMMASLVATTVSYKMAPSRGLSQVAVLDLGIIGTIMAVIGGRLFHIFVEGPIYASPGYSNYYWEHPTHLWQIWRGGFVSYGAFLGLGLGWVVYLRWKKLDTWAYLDHVAVFAGPFIDFFTRLGCLLAGCCYGLKSPFHDHGKYLLYMVFNNRSSDAGYKFPGVPLWPTQIYSMIAAVLIFLICYWIERHRKFKGQVMMSFLMLYAFFRFWIEFLRGDMDRGVYFRDTISTAQIMSILFFVSCAVIYQILKRKNAAAAGAAPARPQAEEKASLPGSAPRDESAH